MLLMYSRSRLPGNVITWATSKVITLNQVITIFNVTFEFEIRLHQATGNIN